MKIKDFIFGFFSTFFFLPLKIPNGICFTLRNKRESDFLLLGEYKEGELVYAGTVTMGVRREILRLLKKGAAHFKALGRRVKKLCGAGRRECALWNICQIHWTRSDSRY